jgi:hypothetical protein
MSTINSSLSNPAAAQAHSQLARSLANLSARTQPAEATAAEAVAPDAAEASDPFQEIARQNQLSSLADSASALSATQSAQALIVGQPAAALAGQANLSSEAAWGLLQN